MRVNWKTALAALVGGALVGYAPTEPSSVWAQSCCAPAVVQAPIPVTSYRLDYQTVYEERQQTGYRIEHETQYEEREVTSFRPVWETEIRERKYMVARPVYETSEREDRRIV